jgi:chromatin-remodeling ATPase INO80
VVKKDIPKAFKQYQKFKVDQENNIKKQSQNCYKEVRKKVIKTNRLQKEGPVRAKKLCKDMMTFWKKRDKEITDLKRRKEKVEKEMRRRMEEEREAVLQKKRLEFIMQQSEIYAHFMSKKLGLSEELQKQKQDAEDDERRESFKRLDIDEKEARQNIAQMINDNRGRVNDFD